MSNESPAQLLAAVLRVVAPGKVTIHSFIVRMGDEWFNPTSKDDLARVVGMLTPEQLERFNTRLWIEVREPMAASVKAADIITAPASTWLAALVAATGARV